MTKFGQVQTIKEKRQAVKRWLFGTSSRVALILCIVVFGVMYLMKTSTLATKGYAISDLQKQMNELEQENERVQVRIAQYGSMANIEERLKSMSLVAVDQVEYISPPQSVVARR